MANKPKIKQLLQENIRPGVRISEQHLNEIVDRIASLPQLDEGGLRKIATEITHDPNAFSVRAIDMSDINDELKNKPNR